MDERLYVIAPIFNPCGYRTRDDLFLQFATYVRQSGAVLIPAECTNRTSPFISSAFDGPAVRVRTDQRLWLKENLINMALAVLPSDARYVCWIDADIQFARPDWVSATIAALQENSIVQMFSMAMYLTPTFEPYQNYRGFAWSHVNNEPHGRGSNFWHPGCAWATTRNRLEATGGLLDRTLGAADHHMAYSIIGRVLDTVQCAITDGHRRLLLEWQDRARNAFKSKIGYVDGLLLHYWHGSIVSRQYLSRWRIIESHHFDPEVDLLYDSNGLLRYSDAGARLESDVSRYFACRDEDSTIIPDRDADDFFGPISTR